MAVRALMFTVNPFLYHTAEFLVTRHGAGLSDCTLVFPNRRAILFFNKYLAEVSGKIMWAPHAVTINELIQSLSGLQLADDLQLVTELYRVYKEEKKSDETFDRFYYWGEMLLNDFNEIDKYRVNAKDLFQNLSSLKEIEKRFDYLTDEQVEAIRGFWKSFDPERYSTHQKDFVEIWNVLYPAYLKFNDYLKVNAIAYEGMMYRSVAEKCKTGFPELSKYGKIIFIGFNALNKCEKYFFDFLKKQGIAEFYWDYDEYYVGDTKHEAGYFLRENIKQFPSPENDFEMNAFTTVPKNIQFIGVSSDIGQAKLLDKILEDFKPDHPSDLMKTAVVLSDESLLLPVLYSLPPEFETINITMGYPLRATPVYSLVEHIIELQKNSKPMADGSCKFYFRNVLKILNHQYLKESGKTAEFAEEIIQKNKVYVPQSDFSNDEFLKKIFVHKENADALTTYLMEILSGIYNKAGADTGSPALEQEYIFKLYTTVKRLHEIISSQNIRFGIQIFLKLLRQVIQNVRIPFEGEPLAGLQVMGILETRSIDFENVIILSANEGILPGGGVSPSFIPYNLRKAFDMPTFDHRDSVYAYYFYRLIQRAKNVVLVYNTKTNERSSGEMSRFMLQLKYESACVISEKTLCYDIALTPPKEITISKSKDILEILNNFIIEYKKDEKNGARRFSASALNSYIDCRLKFYFTYIAGLEEPEEVTEDIDGALFGTLLHKAMELLYTDFKKSKTVVQTTELESLCRQTETIEKSILEAFRLTYFFSNHEIKFSDLNGKNILIFEMLKKYIVQLLEIDKKYAPFQIINLEEYYNARIPVELNGKKEYINIYGGFDRIDRAGEKLRIVDYKTGKVDKTFGAVGELFLEGDPSRSKGVFQTFYYALILSKNGNDPDTICPCLYFTRELFSEKFNCYVKDRENDAEVQSFKLYENVFVEELNKVFQELFNPEVPFTRCDDPKICEYCPYIEICHRET
ncbi:MAG: PD-(D/E)XK nuclease family protein [Bacteroidia bacterium]|nr:PD-(D/E)XK nuclease family protein [Bacteroidia bacterium]